MTWLPLTHIRQLRIGSRIRLRGTEYYLWIVTGLRVENQTTGTPELLVLRQEAPGDGECRGTLENVCGRVCEYEGTLYCPKEPLF